MTKENDTSPQDGDTDYREQIEAITREHDAAEKIARGRRSLAAWAVATGNCPKCGAHSVPDMGEFTGCLVCGWHPER